MLITNEILKFWFECQKHIAKKANNSHVVVYGIRIVDVRINPKDKKVQIKGVKGKFYNAPTGVTTIIQKECRNILAKVF